METSSKQIASDLLGILNPRYPYAVSSDNYLRIKELFSEPENINYLDPNILTLLTRLEIRLKHCQTTSSGVLTTEALLAECHFLNLYSLGGDDPLPLNWVVNLFKEKHPEINENLGLVFTIEEFNIVRPFSNPILTQLYESLNVLLKDEQSKQLIDHYTLTHILPTLDLIGNMQWIVEEALEDTKLMDLFKDTLKLQLQTLVGDLELILGNLHMLDMDEVKYSVTKASSTITKRIQSINGVIENI